MTLHGNASACLKKTSIKYTTTVLTTNAKLLDLILETFQNMVLSTFLSSTLQFMEISTALPMEFFALMVTWKRVSRYKARHREAPQRRLVTLILVRVLVMSRDLVATLTVVTLTVATLTVATSFWIL